MGMGFVVGLRCTGIRGDVNNVNFFGQSGWNLGGLGTRALKNVVSTGCIFYIKKCLSRTETN